MTERLGPARLAELRAQPFTHPHVGATAGALPDGYRALHRRAVLDRDFDAAVDELMRWRVHERAGLWVAASAPIADEDVVVDMRFGTGPLRIRIPCRVVYVVRDPGCVGFAYGTLPGHPESGEERFVLERLPDGRVTFTITAFSRPATRLARLGGPITRMVQDRTADRYLGAAAGPGVIIR